MGQAQGQDRSSTTRRSRAKAVPHSHRKTPTYPNPATGRTWPPRGWDEAGIRNHEIRSQRVQAFLVTWGAAAMGAASSRENYERISPTEARMRELQQFARSPFAAALVLQEATTAVLDLRGFARADTHPIPRAELPQPTRRTGNRAGTYSAARVPQHTKAGRS